MKKNNKKLKLFSLIFLILFCLYFQTLAYSAINSTMTIKGDAYARVDADIRITNFKLSSSSSNSTSSYEEFSVNTIASKFNLLDSSSSIVFDVEVTNYGSSDVGILQVVGTVPTGLSYEIINYNLKDKICDDTGKCNQMAVKTFQIKFTGTPGEYEFNLELDFRTYHKVTYIDVTNNNYPTEVIDGGNLNITFKEDLKKVTILSDGTEIGHYDQINSGQTITIENISNDIEIKKKEPVAKLVSGKIDEVGSEVCIKDECFYIISNDGSKVTMLAKYNLHVGGSYDGEWIAYGDEATGKQDSAMIGFTGILGFDQIYTGVNVFSNTNYWSSTTSSYPSYVYDSNSTLYSYVENYKKYLSTLGVTPSEARLITYEELTSLGCSGDDWSCSKAPSWVYSTSYWTGAAYSSNNIFCVLHNENFVDNEYSWDSHYGCRPVIEMSVDDIYVPKVVNVVSGDYDTVGSEICIDKECFYVISSTDDTVTMLAKYNLYVGGEYNTSWTAYGDEATGKQDSTMLGYVLGQSIRNGTTAFSNTNSTYEESIVEGYVNNYKTILESDYGVDVVEARLITRVELTSEEIGCSATDYTCTGSAYPWIYSTSYWSGSAILADYVWFVSSDGYFSFYDYNDDSDFGVRPVIIISKSNF